MDEATMKIAMKDVGQASSKKLKNTKNKSNTLLEAAKEQYGNWLLGFGISCIPLFALPLYQAFNSKISFWEFVIMLFSSCEVIFVGVSLAVISLNDYIKYNTKKSNKIRWNLFLIAIGAFAYGVMSICSSTEEEFNDLLALGFNIAFLVIIMVLGSAEYIQQIWEARK